MISNPIVQLWKAARGFSRNAKLYLLGTFLMGLGFGSLWTHMNVYLTAVGLGETTIGEILSASSVGTVVVSIPAAIWVDRFAAQRVFLLAAGGFGTCFLLQIFFPHPVLLLVTAFLSGMLFTVHWVAAAPFFMRNAAPEHRTELFGIAAALETLATVLSAFGVGLAARRLGGVLGSEMLGLRWSLAGVAVLTLFAVAPFARIRSEPLAKERRSWREYIMTRDRATLGKLCLPAFLVGCGAGLTIPFLNLYFLHRFDQGPARIGMIFAVAQIFTMAGFLVAPVIARRLTHVRAIVLTELLSIPFFMLLAVSSWLWVAVMAFWLRGALMNMNHPVSTAFAMEIVQAEDQTATNSMRMLAWNLGWMVATPIGGWLIEGRGFVPGMVVTMALYLTAASLFWTFFRSYAVRDASMPVPAEEALVTERSFP